MSYPDTVLDETGTLHRLIKPPLGEGGQGAVFRTTSPEVAIKLIKGRLSRETLQQRLDDVRLLPLSQLQISTPLALLREQSGYAMRLLADMVPISVLISPPGNTELATFYRDTGGLRRRLRVLANAARLLSRVHAIPAVYGDISPNNLFISKDPEQSVCWLIDPDNLHLEGDQGPIVYTPGFGAPEVLAGARPKTLSDAWSFAVLAYQVLCQIHPMLGMAVEDALDASMTVDIEQQAYSGQLPWIHDDDDDSNYSEDGIYPRELALSKGLMALAARALGPGRVTPTARPGLSEWAWQLQIAADLTLRCSNPECRSTFFINQGSCQWCDTPGTPSYLYAQTRRWHPEVDEGWSPFGAAVGHMIFDGDARTSFIPRRMVKPTRPGEDDEPHLKIERIRSQFRVTPLAGSRYTLVETDARTEGTNYNPLVLDRPMLLPVPIRGREWHLHCGPIDRGHRVISFRYFSEVP